MIPGGRVRMTRCGRLAGCIVLVAAGTACGGAARAGIGSAPTPYSVLPDAAETLQRAAPYVGPRPAPPPGAAFDAEHYEVRASIDPAGERLRAHARIWLRWIGEPTGGARNTSTDTLHLRVGDGLAIGRVEVDGDAVRTGREGDDLVLFLPPAVSERAGFVVTLEYEALSRRGLRITQDAAFTYFHTPSWLPVHGDLDDRATLDLIVETPGWRVVGPGGRAKPPEGYLDSTIRWVLAEPAPPYLFGFAAAPLREVWLGDAGSQRLGVLVQPDVPEADVRRAFRDTRRMVAFLEDKAGVPFPTAVYRQVLLPDAPPQEVMTYSLLPRGYLNAVLADSTEDYLIVHELAHQWWGTRVVAADWSHFWLQEGVVSFLVAAWKEERWGPVAYEREIRLARERIRRAREAGPPRALIDAAFATSETAGGAVPYSMGLFVLHELRRELGDEAFWAGFRRFTVEGFRAQAGVTSDDLRRAMEAASGRELDGFFERWVYARDPELGE